VGVHLLLAAVAYLAAFSLRFDFEIPSIELLRFAKTLPYVILLRLVALEMFGVYRGSWRHVGSRDLVALALATTAGSVALVGLLFLADLLAGMPRSVIALDWLIFVFLTGGVRFGLRCAREGQLPLQGGEGRRTIVIGGGGAAEQGAPWLPTRSGAASGKCEPAGRRHTMGCARIESHEAGQQAASPYDGEVL